MPNNESSKYHSIVPFFFFSLSACRDCVIESRDDCNKQPRTSKPVVANVVVTQHVWPRPELESGHRIELQGKNRMRHAWLKSGPVSRLQSDLQGENVMLPPLMLLEPGKIVPNELREGRQMRLDRQGEELDQLKMKVLL